MNESLDRFRNPIEPMDETLVGSGDIQVCKSQNRNYCLGEGLRRIARESDILSLMLRYRAQADREYRRALEDFERLKARRDEIPNEPNNLSQPEQPEELADRNELNLRIPKPAPPAPEPRRAARHRRKTRSLGRQIRQKRPGSPSEPRPKAA